MKKIIFVNGTARCGSTLVDLILGNDPGGFSLGEVASWFRPWRTNHFDIKCGCGVYPCPVWAELREVPEDRLYTELLSRPQIEFAVDSSKKLTWVIDQNRRLRKEPELAVHNVLLYKDPVALHHSYWKRWNLDWRFTAAQYTYYDQALSAGMRPIAINYDWFIRELDTALPSLCQRLGIPYEEGKERYWTKTHHQLFGSFGPRSQMFSSSPSIYVEEFREEFLPMIPGLTESFQSDRRLQAILHELERYDLRNLGSDDGGIRESWKRPTFYWRQRWREIRLRYHPQPFPDREASAIHTWDF